MEIHFNVEFDNVSPFERFKYVNRNEQQTFAGMNIESELFVMQLAHDQNEFVNPFLQNSFVNHHCAGGVWLVIG